jgi:hypothetical protein
MTTVHPTPFYRLIILNREQAHAYRLGCGASSYFAVGILNSAPLTMLSGQRCITLL